MNKKTDSFSAVSALIRTAEWKVDEAQAEHTKANALQVEAEAKLDYAMSRASEAEQLTREFLQRASFSADTLRMSTLNQVIMNEDLLKQQQCHSTANEALTMAREQLLAARTQVQLFERLLGRRVAAQRDEELRLAQRELDDSGVTRAIFNVVTENVITEQGMGHGN